MKRNTIKHKAVYIKNVEINKIESYYKVLKTCKSNERYAIIVRVSYYQSNDVVSNDVYKGSSISTDWKTLGDQIPLIYTNIGDLYKKSEGFLRIIRDRLDETMELYNIKNSDVLGVQLLVYKINYTDKIVEKKTSITFNNLGEHKELINMTQVKKTLSIIPLTPYIENYSVNISKNIVNEVVESVKLIDGTLLYINEFIINNKEENTILDKSCKFYEIDVKDNKYIIVVKSSDDSGILCNNIRVFNMTGYKVSEIYDYINPNSDGFVRVIGNIKMFIDNNQNIVKKEILQNFKNIKLNKLSGYKTNLKFSDYRIGSMDLETYMNKDKISKTYAIGFSTKDEYKTFYINKDLDSDKLIHTCLDEMLKEKYNKHTFYIHNFSRYDVTFILKVVLDMKKDNPDIYDYDLVMKDSSIICLNLSKKYITDKTTKKYTIKLVDSYNILKGSLSDLCKTYNPDVVKSIFPYKFVSEKTLFYTGNKPDISFYDVSENTYKEIKETNWSTKLETDKYLINDLLSLYKIMEIFNKHIWLNYEVHVTNSYTISGIAMEIYLKKYYNNNIPLINQRSIHNDIKFGYYGGITEVYKPYGRDLYYYDVNSLYPHSALKSMPGVNCVYIDNISKNIKDCNNLFGFFYCKIKTNNQYIGLIPIKNKNGIVIMPEGEFEGWYFSEELKFASDNGYDIEVCNGYSFDKSDDVFKDYVSHFYNIKKQTKDKVEKATAKSLLNNLLGRFGLSINKPVTRIVNYKDFQEILQTRKIVGDIKYIGDNILVTYESVISSEICKKYNVDFREVYANELNNPSKNISSYSTENLNNVSVAISAAITSYSRIYMNKIKLDILNNKGNIYYTDTDSIVTDIPLNSNKVDNELGNFKLEYKIKEGYFISSKTYCLVLEDDSVIIKVKGVNSSLSLSDFKNLYNGIDVNTTRYESYKNLSEGYTNINIPRNITLSSNSYKKREKLILDGKWVDSKPLNINEKRKFSTYNIIYKKHVDEKNINFLDIIKKTIKCLSLLSCSIMFVVIAILNFTVLDDVNTDMIFKTIDSNTTYNKVNNNNIISDKIININSNITPKNNKGIYNYKLIETIKDSDINSKYLNKNNIIINKDNTNNKRTFYLLKRINELNVHLTMYKLKEQQDNLMRLDLIKDIDNILKELKKKE